jgi:hypothetical protein
MQLRITNYELPSRLAGVAADADAGRVEHRQQHVVAARVGSAWSSQRKPSPLHEHSRGARPYEGFVVRHNLDGPVRVADKVDFFPVRASNGDQRRPLDMWCA